MSYFDDMTENLTRKAAQNTHRRSFLTRLGQILIASTAMPLLPVDRSAHAATKAKESLTETDCEYWRYCGIDGFLCSCCGGGPSSCPPGTEVSQTAWVGTCFNPADKITYLISYNDCCGVGDCGRCECWRNEGQTPVYRPQTNNDIIWCFGTTTMAYHCSISSVIGKAE